MLFRSRRNYKAESSDIKMSRPVLSGTRLEIPMSLPDDMQLVDGLGLEPEAVQRTWMEILHRSHFRGGLFALVFHTELFDPCHLDYVKSCARPETSDRPYG